MNNNNPELDNDLIKDIVGKLLKLMWTETRGRLPDEAEPALIIDTLSTIAGSFFGNAIEKICEGAEISLSDNGIDGILATIGKTMKEEFAKKRCNDNDE